MRIDLSSLEALEAVIDTGSVTAAANRLNKAPSAISYHLRRLEEVLDVPILDRSGYRLTLTPEGAQLLAEGRILLRKSRDLEWFAQRIRQGWEPNLKIFFDGVLPISWILQALEDPELANAPTKIELHVEFLDNVQASFAEMDGDVMIACSTVPAADFQFFTGNELELVLCCAPGHPLAALQDVRSDDLADHTEIVIRGAETATGAVRPFFASKRVFFLSDFNVKLIAIQQGLGFGWLPDHLAGPLLEAGSLHEVKLLNGSRFSLTPRIAIRSNRPSGKALQRVLDSLLQPPWAPTPLPAP